MPLPTIRAPYESGASCMGDSAGPLDTGLCEYLANQWQQSPLMITRGDFRHDTAVNGVQIDLAVQRMCHEAPLGAI